MSTLAYQNGLNGASGPNGVHRQRHPHRAKQVSYIPSTGVDLIRDTIRHCGISTPIEERQIFGIRGLVPAAHIPIELDVERCMEQMRLKETSLEKYTYLHGIMDVSERLFYAILTKYTAEIMPIVYTPT
jgi:hypothetical protein